MCMSYPTKADNGVTKSASKSRRRKGRYLPGCLERTKSNRKSTNRKDRRNSKRNIRTNY